MAKYRGLNVEILQRLDDCAKIRLPNGRLDLVSLSEIEELQGEGHLETSDDARTIGPDGEVDFEVESEGTAEAAKPPVEPDPTTPESYEAKSSRLDRLFQRPQQLKPPVEPPQRVIRRKGGRW